MRAVVIGSGASLTPEDCWAVQEWATCQNGWQPASMMPHRVVIAVNASFRAARYAHHVYACDNRFWEAYFDEVVHACPLAQRWTVNHGPAKRFGLQVFYDDGETARGRDFGSGLQAVRLAEKLGAEDVALLGFDWGADADGRRHWHQDHPEPCSNSVDFSGAPASIYRMPVTNCSRRTALPWYPTMDLNQWLAQPQPPRS